MGTNVKHCSVSPHKPQIKDSKSVSAISKPNILKARQRAFLTLLEIRDVIS